MPTGVVKTKVDHEKWKKAKKIVEEQHGEIRWPLVMHIFKQMSKDEENVDSKNKNVLIERALEQQGRKTTIPQEAHEALSSWWQKNKSTILTPEQQEKLSSIKQAKQRRSKFKVIKSIKELNYIEQALNKIKEEINFLTKSKNDESSFKNWNPSGFDPKDHASTNALITTHGLHPREASFISGAHTSNESSKGKYFRPTPMSEGLLSHAKRIAKQEFEKHEQKRKESANPAHNPDLFLQHHSKDIHKGFVGNFENDLKNFKESEEFKNVPTAERPVRVMNWKAEWQKQNLQNQKKQAETAADLHGKLADHAKIQRDKALIDQRENILRGGTGSIEPQSSAEISSKAQYGEREEDFEEPTDEDIEDLEGDYHGR